MSTPRRDLPCTPGMTDAEFWERVYGPGARPEPYDYDPAHEAIGPQLDPCPTCGEQGACGWDAEGRPLIHATGADSMIWSAR